MNRFAAEHAFIREVFQEALTGVEPRRLVREHLGTHKELVKTGSGGRLMVIAFGKAAASMALGAHDALGAEIDSGVVLTKDGHITERIPEFEYFEARHPIPDERGAHATSRILEVVEGLSADDVVLALISGGASALLEAPVEHVSLQDLQATTDLLLRAGAPIQDLNAVRTRLSRVKGGGLARAIGDAECHSLILSDVLGNDPRIIASGPTFIQQSEPGSNTALGVVERYDLVNRLPQSVRDVLTLVPQRSSETVSENDTLTVIGDNHRFIDLIEQAVRARNRTCEVVWRDREGEALDAASDFLRDIESSTADVVIGGGETTVTVTGEGQGGRNTEFALAAAIALNTADSWVVASLASDGQDGFADAAGAIADPDSVSNAAAKSVDAGKSLTDNDSATFFRSIDGLVQTGPTGTNVNDVYIAVRIAQNIEAER